MDGFELNKNKHFICREMGVYDTQINEAFSLFFAIPPKHTLTEADSKCVSFCVNNIHGLVYNDHDLVNEEILPQSEVEIVFLELSRAAAIKNQVIAFKGGSCELNIIRKCKISNYVDLEKMGCLKFEKLLELYGRDCLKTCNHHRPLKNGKEPHCPQAEVIYFNRWWWCHLNNS